jgi:hypothetical protein
MGMGSALAVSNVSGQSQKPVAKKDVSWLFVVSAGTGTLMPKGAGTYTLKMNLPDMNQALQFSDRPNRLVKVIGTSELKQQWSKENAGGFASDAPNAVLTTTNFRPIIVTVNGIEVKGNSVFFTVNVIKGNPGHFPTTQVQLRKVVLTIDNGHSCPSGEYWSWIGQCEMFSAP